MTRIVIVLVLLSAVSRLSAQVPPPLTPGEIARLGERMRLLHCFRGNFGGVLHRRYVKGGVDGAPAFRYCGRYSDRKLVNESDA